MNMWQQWQCIIGCGAGCLVGSPAASVNVNKKRKKKSQELRFFFKISNSVKRYSIK
jgi:hypothetical protein